jgi:tRNA-dihydrouridine synthase A
MTEAAGNGDILLSRDAGEGTFSFSSTGKGECPLVLDRRISVAPMMDYTDRYCRYLHRLLTPGALLYTEMVTAQALAHGHVERLLAFDRAESPVALQVGGSDPRLLAEAAKLGEQRGYAEINLNVGCPSDRVQEGNFGACLMAEPQLVCDCLVAMREAVSVPVTVKCRIGIDELDDYGFFDHFVQLVRRSGVNVFIVHARKAILQGLTPKENREIPPLRYEVVARLKHENPELTVILNGGLKTVGQVREWWKSCDGVMLGRQAYQEPYLLAELHREFVDRDWAPPSREEVVLKYASYVERMLGEGHRLGLMLRPLHGLYAGFEGARSWRRFLAEQGSRPGAGAEVLQESLRVFRRAA